MAKKEAKYDEMTPEELKAELRRRDEMSKLDSDTSGAIIKTPNREYIGATKGIQFHNGIAFIPAPPAGDESRVQDFENLVNDMEFVYGYEVERDVSVTEYHNMTR